MMLGLKKSALFLYFLSFSCLADMLYEPRHMGWRVVCNHPLCGKTLPPTGNGAIEAWRALHPDQSSATFGARFCSYTGQKIFLSCIPPQSCRSSFRCNYRYVCRDGDDIVSPAGGIKCRYNGEPSDDTPSKDSGEGCKDNKVGNPCDVATGNKFQSEQDTSSGLPFTRYYNSNNLVDLGLGLGWQHSYQARLVFNPDHIVQVSASGRGEPWVKTNGQWQGDEDSDVILTETESGFTVTKANAVVEDYHGDGTLMRVRQPSGATLSFSHDANGLLETVTNHYNQRLVLVHTDQKLVSVTDHMGATYRYEYDVHANLVAVIYPDLTPDDETDNPRKVYHYENADFPNHLTGITDENGDRYATWRYDAQGKAIVTKHAQTTNDVGQETFTLDFQ